MAREKAGKGSQGDDTGSSEKQETFARCFSLVCKGTLEEINQRLATLPKGYERSLLKELSFGRRYEMGIKPERLALTARAAIQKADG